MLLSVGFEFLNDLKLAHDGESLWDRLDGELTPGLGLFCDLAPSTDISCGMHMALDWAHYNEVKDEETQWSLIYDRTRRAAMAALRWEHSSYLANGNGVDTTAMNIDAFGAVSLQKTVSFEF